MATIVGQSDFDVAHDEFCCSLQTEICTAGKKLKNGRILQRGPCSYGHAAKVLDIAAKVYVYYCNQPSPNEAGRMLPFLHYALDRPMMKLLGSSRETIKEVDREHYLWLQENVSSEIAAWGLYRVQYDDVMWRRIQRSQA